MKNKIRIFTAFLLLAFVFSACQILTQSTDIPAGDKSESAKVGACGDGICNGPENENNCPQDCSPQEGASQVIEDSPRLYLGIMVHLEGWQSIKFNEDAFDDYMSIIREYADLFEKYGAKLTLETINVAEASTIFNDNILKEMEDRGHGIGVHADIGGQLDYNCNLFSRELKVMKDELEGLGLSTRHASGVVSHCDWVGAMVKSGYEFTTGNVAYSLMSLPEDLRPPEYRNCASPLVCHDTYPEELEGRIHPWRMNSGSDWIYHDPNGKLVMLPSSHGLACFDETLKDIPCNQDFSKGDIDLFFQEIDDALELIDPNQVNMYYVSWSLGKQLDEQLMEEWLQRLQAYVDSGKIEWKTLPEFYDAYLMWERQ